jgi:hypothetical protein
LVRPWRKAEAAVVAVLEEAPVVRAPVAEPPEVPRAAQPVVRAGLADPAHLPEQGAAADRAALAAAGLNTRSAVARELRARAE